MERIFIVTALLALIGIVTVVAYREGQRSARRPIRESHGPMTIIVTNAQDGFEAMPEKINHDVTVSVITSGWDGGSDIECRTNR